MSQLPVSPSLLRKLEQAFDPTFRVPAWLDARRDAAAGEQRARWIERRDELEAHVRLHRVDRILRALGWNVDTAGDDEVERLSNVSIEVAVRAPTARFRKRMDYFGFDSADHAPLLIAESKAPGVRLGIENGHAHPLNHPQAVAITTYLREGRIPDGLPESLAEAVEQLRAYARDVSRVDRPPARALLSNGHWLIVFIDPRNTLAGDVAPDGAEKSIAVFESPGLVMRHAEELERLLSYSSLARQTEPISSARVRAFIDPASVRTVAKALRVLRTEDELWSSSVPRIEVCPLLILAGEGGARIVVHGNTNDREVPFARDSGILEHLAEVEADARSLWTDTERCLQAPLPSPTPIARLVADPMSPWWGPVIPVPDQSETRAPRRFFVLTGDRSHFLDPEPAYHGCSGHEFDTLTLAGKARGTAPIVAPSVSPRAFFPNRSVHHCCNKAIHDGRLGEGGSSATPGDSPDDIRPRSPLCFVREIDEFLCCRSCVFKSVCTVDARFRGVATNCEAISITVMGKPAPASETQVDAREPAEA